MKLSNIRKRSVKENPHVYLRHAIVFITRLVVYYEL